MRIWFLSILSHICLHGEIPSAVGMTSAGPTTGQAVARRAGEPGGERDGGGSAVLLIELYGAEPRHRRHSTGNL